MAHLDSYSDIIILIPTCASLATVSFLGEYRVFLLGNAAVDARDQGQLLGWLDADTVRQSNAYHDRIGPVIAALVTARINAQMKVELGRREQLD